MLRHRGSLEPFVPDSGITNSISWTKPPAEGEYRVVGTVRPSGGPAVRIDRTITISKKDGRSLEDTTGQAPAPPGSGPTPILLWIALGIAVMLALGSAAGYWRMRQRMREVPVNA